MNPDMNQPTDTSALSTSPMKRKRGRPRKDDTPPLPSLTIRPPPLRPIMTRAMQVVEGGSSPVNPAAAVSSSKGKEKIQHNNNDDPMVGQVVTGVLERTFDAGYFVKVRVGNSDVYMKGIVFKETCVVPVTPENDIAPGVKMYERKNIPIPKFSLALRAVENYSKKLTESTQNQQREHPVLETAPQQVVDNIPQEDVEKENEHNTVPEVPTSDQAGAKLSFSERETVIEPLPYAKETEDPFKTEDFGFLSEPETVTETVSDVQEKGEPFTREESLGGSSEPEAVTETVSDVKEKEESSTREGEAVTEQVFDVKEREEAFGSEGVEGLSDTEKGATVSGSNEEDETAEAVVKDDCEAATAEETGVEQPSAEEVEVYGASGFQISMENTDTDEPDKVPEFSDDIFGGSNCFSLLFLLGSSSFVR